MDYQTEPITMWFNRRLVLRRSPIHGIGTFATHDIDADEEVTADYYDESTLQVCN